MPPLSKKYYFEEVHHCEMCGDPTGKHKVLGQRMNRSQGTKRKGDSGISVSIKKCSNCQLIYSSPQPVPFDLQDHYGIPPENYWTPDYFTWTPDYFQKEIGTFKSLVDFKKGMKALDVGAGIGKAMLSLEKAGFDSCGFEPSRSFYEKAISEMKIDPEKLQRGSIEEVIYPPEYFDFISFGAVLEHVYHPAASIKKALTWLKPGGLINIDVPSSKHLVSKMINIFYKLKGTNYVTNLSPMHEPFHMYEFSLRSFEELGKRIGYTIVQHEYNVGTVNPVPRPLHSIFKKYMKMTNAGMQLGVWLRKAEV
jgi:2-polyprenyl-3-methyl-5-hydroxy-6-metoxy-1,4-benzoquinol methylase